MKVTAWRLRDGQETYTYHVQVDDLPIKSRAVVLKHFSDFKVVAEMFPPIESSSVNIVFSKMFETEKDWQIRAEEIPYGVTEYSSTSDRVKFKCKAKVVVKTGKTKTCSVCGEKGHNARTCKKVKK